eukprot:tig00000946_g5568.t1
MIRHSSPRSTYLACKIACTGLLSVPNQLQRFIITDAAAASAASSLQLPVCGDTFRGCRQRLAGAGAGAGVKFLVDDILEPCAKLEDKMVSILRTYPVTDTGARPTDQAHTPLLARRTIDEMLPMDLFRLIAASGGPSGLASLAATCQKFMQMACAGELGPAETATVTVGNSLLAPQPGMSRLVWPPEEAADTIACIEAAKRGADTYAPNCDDLYALLRQNRYFAASSPLSSVSSPAAGSRGALHDQALQPRSTYLACKIACTGLLSVPNQLQRFIITDAAAASAASSLQLPVCGDTFRGCRQRLAGAGAGAGVKFLVDDILEPCAKLEDKMVSILRTYPVTDTGARPTDQAHPPLLARRTIDEMLPLDLFRLIAASGGPSGLASLAATCQKFMQMACAGELGPAETATVTVGNSLLAPQPGMSRLVWPPEEAADTIACIEAAKRGADAYTPDYDDLYALLRQNRYFAGVKKLRLVLGCNVIGP